MTHWMWQTRSGSYKQSPFLVATHSFFKRAFFGLQRRIKCEKLQKKKSRHGYRDFVELNFKVDLFSISHTVLFFPPKIFFWRRPLSPVHTQVCKPMTVLYALLYYVCTSYEILNSSATSVSIIKQTTVLCSNVTSNAGRIKGERERGGGRENR